MDRLRSLGRAIAVLDFSEARAWGQLLVVLGAVGVYEIAHAISGNHDASAIGHAWQVLGLEGRLGINWEHSAQRVVLDHDAWRQLANGVYTWAYWPVILGGLALLWRVDRRLYAVLRNGMLLSGAIGLLIFVTYPVAPPRLLPGFSDTIPTGSLEHAVVHGSVADPFAALPSFHAGWVVLSATVLAVALRRPLASGLAVTISAAMCLAVVTTANHYVVDVIGGVVVALAGGVVAYRITIPRSWPPLPGRDGSEAFPEPDRVLQGAERPGCTPTTRSSAR
jgi:membrane-associated phospholipid phosphatase